MTTQRIPVSEIDPKDASFIALPDDLLVDPRDYTAVGGPESEPAYGRSRAIDGEYPFNGQGGSHDADDPSHIDRGGTFTHHRVVKRT